MTDCFEIDEVRPAWHKVGTTKIRASDVSGFRTIVRDGQTITEIRLVNGDSLFTTTEASLVGTRFGLASIGIAEHEKPTDTKLERKASPQVERSAAPHPAIVNGYALAVREDALRRIREGDSVAVVSRETGITRATLHAWMHKEGIVSAYGRGSHSVPNEIRQKALAMVQLGIPARDVANQLRLSVSKVSAWVERDARNARSVEREAGRE